MNVENNFNRFHNDNVELYFINFRVKHIKGLRVIDASVMPIIPSGNVGVPTTMVAEKASDIIKATINCHKNVLVEDHWDQGNSNKWDTLTDDGKDLNSHFEKNADFVKSEIYA